MDTTEQQEPALLVLGGRRGRPRASEPRTSVSTWIPTRLHDELSKAAIKHGVSVSSIVRLCVSMQLGKKKV